MRTYGLGYLQTMDLPMRVFWHLSGSVERLRKEEARLEFEIQASVPDANAAAQMREHLAQAAPDPITVNKRAMAMSEELDRGGLDLLRMTN